MIPCRFRSKTRRAWWLFSSFLFSEAMPMVPVDEVRGVGGRGNVLPCTWAPLPSDLRWEYAVRLLVFGRWAIDRSLGSAVDGPGDDSIASPLVQHAEKKA